jgi:hypothetical protein
MKNLLIGLLAFVSVSAYADTIILKNGESIYMNGTVVKCEGSGQRTGNSIYADLPWNKLLTLLQAGLGPCQIRFTQGRNAEPFYYSPKFNGLHVNSQSQGIVRDDIRNGNCE